jgi:hypothetical protein
MKLKLIIAGVILLLCCFRGYSQDNSFTGDKAIAALKSFFSNHSAEKAYLQFDKPYYAAGDTMYFKAYVTFGERHQLSALSGVLHVDLINTNNQIDKSIKLQLTNGLAWGDFLLPDSLPEGNYRVRAYTQLMRNDGDAAFFDRVIPVGSNQPKPIPESIIGGASANEKADLQFFPEGGNLVCGIRSKVAFKAINKNGKGIDVTGVVVDNNNNEAGNFTSAHLGTGYFYLKPEEGKSYIARLTYADGSQGAMKLPIAEPRGLVLIVNNDSVPVATVKVEANKACFTQNKGKDYTMVIYSGDMATTVTCKLDSPTIKLDIIKRRLRTGVAVITLFSPTSEPLSERLIFIQNYDQLAIDVNGDKKSYSPKNKVSIKLSVKNRADSAVMGHFSVSVIDEHKVKVNENTENTILTNLLLTSDLKGTVEEPDYYFTDIDDVKLRNLDLVMLTNGYRKFEWKALLNNDPRPVIYQAEKALEITGNAKMLSGKPIIKGPVSLIATGSGGILTDLTDAKGNFHFTNLVYMDSARFILQAVNAKGSNNTMLSYNADKPAPVLPFQNLQTTPADTDPGIKAYMKNAEKQQEQLNKQGLGKGTMLSEVKIKGRKLEPIVMSSRYGIADYILHGKDIRFGGQLSYRLMDRIPGVVITQHGLSAGAILRRNLHFRPKPMRIIMDDIEMPADFDLNSISTGSIDKIEVMSTTSDLDTDGALLITTKHGLQPEDMVSTGFLAIKANGFYKAREFYSPKYESTVSGKFADLRTTIYWNPEITTDKEGNATFEYYNADGTGSYRVVVEGIDEKGNLGRQVYKYKVE